MQATNCLTWNDYKLKKIELTQQSEKSGQSAQGHTDKLHIWTRDEHQVEGGGFPGNQTVGETITQIQEETPK